MGMQDNEKSFDSVKDMEYIRRRISGHLKNS